MIFFNQVLDLESLDWLSTDEVSYPSIFDDMRQNAGGIYDGYDRTMLLYRTNQQARRTWLQDIVAAGFVNSRTIGCLALDVVLYLSLIFIIRVVAIRFEMALWLFSVESGNFPRITYEQ